MQQVTRKELLQSFVPSADLRRVVIPGVDASQWMPIATRTSVHDAIQHLLEDLPRQAPVEVVELVDGAQADQIRRTHAARAVLSALMAGAFEAPT